MTAFGLWLKLSFPRIGTAFLARVWGYPRAPLSDVYHLRMMTVTTSYIL